MKSFTTWIVFVLILTTCSFAQANDELTETATDRFLEYVLIDSSSVAPEIDSENRTQPSSIGQQVLSAKIQSELYQIGLPEDRLTTLDDSSFFVHLPATQGHNRAPHIAYAAHMDTYYLVSGDVTPQTHTVVADSDIVLQNNVTIPAEQLINFVDQEVITSDGTSVLGADDKAGVAILVTVIETILDKNLPHGELTFWFCVDEEIGGINAGLLPRELVESWDLLWTVDGQELGPIDVANFVGRYVTVTFKGMDAHPGDDGARLRPAAYGAVAMSAELLTEPTPMETSGLESFHLVDTITANASEAVVVCLPRSFDHDESDAMVKHIRQLADQAAELYRLDVEVVDDTHYVNVGEDTMEVEYLILPAMDAHRSHGIEPFYQHARGGTDHAMIKMTIPSIRGANMGTGGRNMHSPNEFLVVEEFGQALSVVMHMIDLYSEFDGRL